MTFGIIIATYKRPDGKTFAYLNRALESIKKQTYQNYLVLLIGDNYEDYEELLSISKNIDSDKLYLENLSIAVEREKYTGYLLWASGGLNAMNHAISIGLSKGIEYFCHLDHDDYWAPDHLFNFKNSLNEKKYHFLVSYSTSPVFNKILPNYNNDEIMPIPCGMIHSSTCINFSFFKERYRDVFEETGTAYPADADLWDRLNNTMTNLNIKGKLIKKITCFHDTEGE